MSKQKIIQSVKGMHDILPPDQPHWKHIYKKVSGLFEDYGYEKIDTPILEPADLFLRSIGEATDIVEKEMYTFKTRGGDELALRPENTASVVRAYLENGMNVWPHPVKLWYWGPMFRHDQPQAGRYRQFHQFGVEAFGDESSAADAEVIYMALLFLEGLGFKNLVLKINSIGDANCRPQFIKAFKDFFKSRNKKLCAQCKLRLKTNVLRILDCKEIICREIFKEAPQFLDFLDENCRDHFKKVIEFLDEIKAPYMLDPYLVRGLDYYTNTVFEIALEETPPLAVAEEKPDDKEKSKEQPVSTGLTLVAGGRYNKLVNLLGGPVTPAVGWAAGVERLVAAMKNFNLRIPESKSQPKIFLAQLGDFAKRKSLVLFEEFRRNGIKAGTSLGRDSIKAQLRIANRLNVKFTLIIGHKEAIDKTVILREMDSGIQEVIPMEGIIEAVKKRLKS
ncbi:MAG: histidine--tRNA ligase [bacterium]|nr:histidine--tRNA ligase [bacterium]